jgi:oligopeptide transport system substrate-binding protein
MSSISSSFRASRRTVLLGVSAAGLAACAPGAPPPGLLRVATNGMPDSLDPALGQFAAAALVYKQIHAGLTEYGADGQLAPGLAEDWSVSADGLNWTFRLRDGLRWSDGTGLTAQDVVWSARRLVDPAQSFADLGDFFAVENSAAVLAGESPAEALGVEALDVRTVRFRLTSPLGLLPILMREFYPFPRHVIERHGADWVRPENLVTAGAYTVTEMTQLGLRLVKNPHFYNADTVAITEIQLDAVRDDATRARMFRAGEYDLADRPAANQIDFLRDRLGSQFQSFDAPILRYLKLNHARPELARASVRRPLSAAIDRDFLAQTIFGGTASATRTVTPPLPEITRYLGLPARNVAPDTLSLDRALEIRATPGIGERLAIAIADDWARIGVETELLISYPTDLYQAVDAGEFDVAVASFNRGLKSDPFFMLDPFEPGGFAANFGWDDAIFAEMMARARRENDPAERPVSYASAEWRIYEEGALIPLVHDRAHWLVGERVAGTRSDVQPMLWRDLALFEA